jgi:NADH-quinone oxidoreductase subunit M
VNGSILTLITFLPAVGALLLMLMPRNDRALRWAALIISIATFGFSVYLPLNFDRGTPGFQFDVNHNWIGQVIHYHMGADGISMWLVLLTTLLVPVSVLVSWKSIHDRVKEFFVLLLLLEMAMIGVFLALDMFLFGAAHWHVRPRAPGLRRRKIFPLYDGRVRLHAGRDHLAVCAHGHTHDACQL